MFVLLKVFTFKNNKAAKWLSVVTDPNIKALRQGAEVTESSVLGSPHNSVKV